jgi:hypothetical protein
VNIPITNKSAPNKNCGGMAPSFAAYPYNHGDTINKKPINTSNTWCICIGNCLIKPPSLRENIAITNLIHPIYMGISRAALDTL